MGMRKPQGGQRYAANTCRNQAWERRVVVVKQREEFWKDGGSWDRGHGDKRARRVMEGERLVGAKGPNIKTCEELQCVRAKTRHHPPISPVALCGMPSILPSTNFSCTSIRRLILFTTIDWLQKKKRTTGVRFEPTSARGWCCY